MKAKSAVSELKSEVNLSWRKSVEKNGITKTINVEKLDNTGYLVRVSIYGEDSTKTNPKYISIEKKYYFESNPLEEEEEIDPLTELSNMLSASNKK